MPLRVNDLVRQTKDTVIPTPLGDINVTYRPHALTPNDNAALAAATGRESFAILLRQYESYVESWDLEGPIFSKVDGSVVVPEGEQVPVKAEVLQHLSSVLLGQIFRAIQDDAIPKAKTASSSSSNIFEGSFA